MAPLLCILAALLCSIPLSHARTLQAVGVEQIPLLQSGKPVWIHPDHLNFSGPLGAYLDTLLRGCGFFDGVNITYWAKTSRMAEYDVLTGVADIAFPVYRLWATAPTTLSVEAGGGHFLPVLSSPGSTILWNYVFVPTTIAQALTSPDILVILLAVICIAIIGGVFMWFIDRYTPESNFPPDFAGGVLVGVYWAIVSMVTVGYGDKVPKSRLARGFTVIFLLIGVMMIALLQSWVIDHVSSTRDVYVQQLQKASDVLNGVKVGVVNASLEEWRMRALGAQVVVYDTVQQGMNDLSDNSNPLYAFAVDMLSAAVVMNTLGGNNIRPSGTVLESTTYGFVLNNVTANLPATLYDTGLQMPLAECLDLLTRAGPVEFSKLVYFRGVDSYMAFSVNEDLRDQELQASVSADAMAKTQYIAPVLAVATVVLAYVIDRLFLRHRRIAAQQSRYNELQNDGAGGAGGAAGVGSGDKDGHDGSTHGNTHRDDKENVAMEDMELAPLHHFEQDERLDHLGGDDDDEYDDAHETAFASSHESKA